MFNVRDSSKKIEKLLIIYENEENKLKKIQILNKINEEIKSLEKHLENNYGTVHIAEKIKLIKELKIQKHKNITEQEKKYKITLYSKLANRFFSNITEFLLETFSNLNKKTTLLIRGSGLRILTNTYISSTLFSSILLLFLGAVIGIIIFYQTSYLHGLFLGPILSIITLLTFIIYPIYRFNKRKRELNEEYPFLINYIAALSNSKIKNISLFETLINSHQKTLIPELKKIILYTKIFNLPIYESIIKGTEDIPSEKTKKFFLELSEIYRSHSDPTIFLNKKAHESLIEYESLNKSPFKIIKNLFHENLDILKQTKFDTFRIITIIMGLTSIALTYIYTNIESILFPLFILISFIIIWIPIFISVYKTWIQNKEKEKQFLIFVKDLNQTKNPLELTKNYTSLDTNIKKFIHQYKLGIQLEKAFNTFAKESNNSLVESSIILALESKKHNADIYEALENITRSKIIRNILRTEKI